MRIPTALLSATVFATAALASSACLAGPSQAATPIEAAEPARIPVKADGLVGDLYLPVGRTGRGPAVLVLGGSEGAMVGSTYEARDLARRGYVALALAYFRAPGVPDQLVDVPLEYFGSALAMLAARTDVDPSRIGVMGTSKGGEAALLVASTFPQVHAVVAGVPSNVVWQGINAANRSDPRGSWSLGGKPVAFVPYDMSAPFTSIHDLYARSLATLPAHQDAVIPVERIRGPVMLVCGQADTIWPSCQMSDAVAGRLRAHRFGFAVQQSSYPRAGHAAFGLPIPDGNPAKAMLNALGGDAEGNDAARTASWGKAIAFLNSALKR